MLREGRLPLLAAEHAAVDKLVEMNPGKAVSMTRRDPGESGPLLVHIGDVTYMVNEAGRARKQPTKASS